jgi:hypothetical protein
VYDVHVPDESKKNSALCVGVIEGVALVTVAEADTVFVGEIVSEVLTDVVAVFEGLAFTDSEALAVFDIVDEGVSDFEAEAEIDAVRLAVFEGVLLGVPVLDGDAPTKRWQRHALSAVQVSTAVSELI